MGLDVSPTVIAEVARSMFAGANHPKRMTTGHLHAGQPALHDQFSPLGRFT